MKALNGHRTEDDLSRRSNARALRFIERKIRRTVYASRTDLLFAEAVRPS